MDFPHLFPTWMRVGFAPVLCSAYLLLATWVSEIAVKFRLVLLTSSTGFSSNTVSFWATTNGLGKLQKTTALVQYQIGLSTQKLHQPFNWNHRLERFVTCLPFASAAGSLNSRTSNLDNWSPACTYEAYRLYIVLSVLKPIHSFYDLHIFGAHIYKNLLLLSL